MTVVWVRWLDSMSYGLRWRNRDDLIEEVGRESLVHETVGFLVFESEESITLAGSRGPVNVSDVKTIPKGAIVERGEFVVSRLPA